MIQTSELMLGNYVNDEFGYLIKVGSISKCYGRTSAHGTKFNIHINR